MLQNRFVWGVLIIAVLILANIINYFVSGWGLITVKVHDAALSKVIKSVERQGGVTIYTNADLAAPITMDVYRVPLTEAMQTLSENIPPPDTTADAPPAAGAATPGRPGGGRRGGFGGGFGGAQWHLAFFAAPSSGQIKEEISAFQAGGADDDHKVFNYMTPVQMLSTDAYMPVADPRLQVWSGLKSLPTPAPAAAAGDASAQSGTDPNASPDAPPSNIQDYLNVLAQSADIWIMAPSSWDAKISEAPAANSSISDAVKTVVGRAHGSVEQALILVVRTPGQRGGGRGGGRGFVGGDTGWSYMQDRLNNAINGLPPDARADASAQLAQEVNFRKSVMAAPADQRRQLIGSHMMDRMANMDNWRRSPQMRAKMYSRAVANRQAVKGQ